MKRLINTISLWFKRFSYWKEHGSPIKPLYEGTTKCRHCGTVFDGNFCPRCGQSRSVSRVNKIGFVMTFMEAYPQLAGSYLRTMWQLLFRPGYLIRDYFRGHRIPYSGPFKTFIITVSIFALFTKVVRPQFLSDEVSLSQMQTEYSTSEKKGDQSMSRFFQMLQNTDKRIEAHEKIAPLWKMFKDKAEDGSTIYLFLFVPLLALGCKTVFHKQLFSGRKLIYAEHFMTLVYLYCIDLLYTVLFVFAGMDETDEYSLWATPLYFVWTYRGIYGWTWKETCKNMLLYSLWLLFIAMMFLIALLILVAWIYYAFVV